MTKPPQEQHKPNLTANANQVQAQIIRGLRSFIILNILKTKPLHGYGIITIIRKNFGIYLGPSSVYPLLNDLETWKYLNSTWETENLHPKRIYNLTSYGQDLLDYLAKSFGPIMMKMGVSGNTQPVEKE